MEMNSKEYLEENADRCSRNPEQSDYKKKQQIEKGQILPKETLEDSEGKM